MIEVFVIMYFILVLCGFFIFIYFFFFKQKTAYEMRISDWSSDVCSSDLPHRPAVAQGAVQSGQKPVVPVARIGGAVVAVDVRVGAGGLRPQVLAGAGARAGEAASRTARGVLADRKSVV